MFRRGSTPAPSAADAERQALFEKLAQRPETVCPFLGLANARAEYEAQATDEHRCYAFGEPEPVSGDQQRNVCLQRGYANCPRYLRGVLVIPTDELEALRRPPQRVPPPPPPPPRVATTQPPRSRGLAVAGIVVALLVGGVGAWWFLAGPGSVAEGPTPTPGATTTGSPGATASGVPTPGASPVTHIAGTDAFEPVGSSSRTEDGIRLTPAELRAAGAAWFPVPVLVADGFTAEFTFRLSGFQGDGGDGFAFVLQTTGAEAVGGIGGDLGYGGIERSLAVEFDTHFNSWPGRPDPNDNHVSVHTDDEGPNSGDHALSLGETTAIPDLSTGQAHAARIVYAPGTLTVFVDGVSVLEVGIDLAAALSLEGGTAFVGFTASTGDTAQNTDILALEISLP